LAAWSRTVWRTSRCSTTLPSASSRKISMPTPARPTTHCGSVARRSRPRRRPERNPLAGVLAGHLLEVGDAPVQHVRPLTEIEVVGDQKRWG
jgi:hypothetical protein